MITGHTKSITLNKRQLCDLELLLNGAFYPLTGFMNEMDYKSCLYNMTLADESVWPIPIILAVDLALHPVTLHDIIILKDETGIPIAEMIVDDIYQPIIKDELEHVLGSNDPNHPYYPIVMGYQKHHYLGGHVHPIRPIIHYDFKDLRLTPQQTNAYFRENNWTHIIGFQTRNPLHKAHYILTQYAMHETGSDAKLLLHPIVGITQDCDIDYHTRVRCYKKIITKYAPGTVLLSLLPLSMRMAGPREALWHALIRKNYGCTHFIVGRDHAGPSYKTSDGNPFYDPYDAHQLLIQYESRIGIKIILSPNIVFVNELGEFRKETEIPEGMTISNLSGTALRDLIYHQKDVPNWFSWPDIIDELRNEHKSGLCVYFIGLSGSGKSTMANVLMDTLRESRRCVTLLDADIVRLNLSKGLGFSKEDRSTNVRRIGYVASEIVKHGGCVICANIAPYDEDRQYNRKMISQHGTYLEVYMNTSLECCERRDVKGLYKLAKQGMITNFTGINDPFEEPMSPDLVINGDEQQCSVEFNLNRILEIIYRD